MYGYKGKILKVDLTTGAFTVDEHDEYWYRTYMGGGAFGGWYMLHDCPVGADPLGPENVFVVAISVVTGAPVPGFCRHSVITKSPESGMMCTSEAGGWFGSELKFAGYDAVVITGKAPKPCYLLIHDGVPELRDASAVWGQDTLDAQKMIREETGLPRARMIMIGRGGENLVRYANVLNEGKHANGRGGTGAVMGSKNLKAVVCSGKKSTMELYCKEKVLALSKWFGDNYMEYPNTAGNHRFGSADLVTWQMEHQEFPSYNFTAGVVEDGENLSGTTMAETILTGTEGCYACPVRCKRVVETGAPYFVDPAYGGPEYETIGAFGSLCGINDLPAVCKANELCNRYSLDTISAGVAISFAMELYQKGILTDEDVGGIDMSFGNIDTMLKLITMIGNREGIGDLLAEGVKRAAEKIGKGSEYYAMHAKGVEIALHDPRVRPNVGLGYAVSNNGGDHVIVEHDPDFDEYAAAEFVEQQTPLGILERLNAHRTTWKKIRSYYYLQQDFGIADSLTICLYVLAPVRLFKLTQLVDLVQNITGWEVSLHELMKLGERKVNLARAFNYREGFRREDDKLPERFFKEPLRKEGAPDVVLDKKVHDRAIDAIYMMSGWMPDGRPGYAKLYELDLAWVVDILWPELAAEDVLPQM